MRFQKYSDACGQGPKFRFISFDFYSMILSAFAFMSRKKTNERFINFDILKVRFLSNLIHSCDLKMSNEIFSLTFTVVLASNSNRKILFSFRQQHSKQQMIFDWIHSVAVFFIGGDERD